MSEGLLREQVHETMPDPVLDRATILMNAIEARVDSYEMPLFNALQIEYADKIARRGWMVCGPASIVLANVLSEDTRLPVIDHRVRPDEECFQLAMYMVNPFDDPNGPPRMDHTVVHYHTGLGFSMTIDPVYQLLLRNSAVVPRAIAIERHYSNNIQDNMLAYYGLRRMGELRHHFRNEGWPNIWAIPGRVTEQEDIEDALDIMSGPEVFRDAVELSSGEIIDVSAYWGQRLWRTMQRVRKQVPLDPAVRL